MKRIITILFIFSIFLGKSFGQKDKGKDTIIKGRRTLYLPTVVKTINAPNEIRNLQTSNYIEYITKLNTADSIYSYTCSFYIKKTGKIDNLKVSYLDCNKDYKEIISENHLWGESFLIYHNNIKTNKPSLNAINLAKGRNIKKRTLVIIPYKCYVFIKKV